MLCRGRASLLFVGLLYLVPRSSKTKPGREWGNRFTHLSMFSPWGRWWEAYPHTLAKLLRVHSCWTGTLSKKKQILGHSWIFGEMPLYKAWDVKRSKTKVLVASGYVRRICYKSRWVVLRLFDLRIQSIIVSVRSEDMIISGFIQTLHAI